MGIFNSFKIKNFLIRHMLTTAYFLFCLIVLFRHLGDGTVRFGSIVGSLVWMALIFALETGYHKRGKWRITSVILAVLFSIGFIWLISFKNSTERDILNAAYGGDAAKMDFVRSCYKQSKDEVLCGCMYKELKDKNAFSLPEEEQVLFIKNNINNILDQCNLGKSH